MFIQDPDFGPPIFINFSFSSNSRAGVMEVFLDVSNNQKNKNTNSENQGKWVTTKPIVKKLSSKGAASQNLASFFLYSYLAMGGVHFLQDKDIV